MRGTPSVMHCLRIVACEATPWRKTRPARVSSRPHLPRGIRARGCTRHWRIRQTARSRAFKGLSAYTWRCSTASHPLERRSSASGSCRQERPQAGRGRTRSWQPSGGSWRRSSSFRAANGCAGAATTRSPPALALLLDLRAERTHTGVRRKFLQRGSPDEQGPAAPGARDCAHRRPRCARGLAVRRQYELRVDTTVGLDAVGTRDPCSAWSRDPAVGDS